jgi:hypothetical protein
MKCEVVVNPAESDLGCFAGIAPLKNAVLVFMHREFRSPFDDSPPSGDSKPPSDRVYYKQDGGWHEVPGKSAVDFVIKDIVVGDEAAYIKTIYGELFRVTRSEITRLETLGTVEAMTVTSAGNLLAAFRNNGIYEYKDGWQKKFESPYAAAEPDHHASLAEDSGRIAFSISSERELSGPGAVGPRRTALWISDGTELKPASTVNGSF